VYKDNLCKKHRKAFKKWKKERKSAEEQELLSVASQSAPVFVAESACVSRNKK